MDTFTKHAYLKAKHITKHHGKRYYFATRFLPKTQRRAIHALYAFFRIPDEMVDNPDSHLSVDDIHHQLEQWHTEWHNAYTAGVSNDPILHIPAHTFHAFNIPYSYGDAFLSAMKRDLTQKRYDTYNELRAYMYGSAQVVGLMCTHIFGYQEGALPYAAKLGEAMQLTNFLRDIREDYEERNRIYLPHEDMDMFEVTEEHIRNGICNEAFQNLMQYEISRVRELFKEANPGIRLLSSNVRFGVVLASRLYESILDEIERVNYDVFSHTITPSPATKLRIVLSNLQS